MRTHFACALLLVMGCGGAGTGPTPSSPPPPAPQPPPPPPAPAPFTITTPGSVGVGGTLPLSSSVTPATAISWAIEPAGIASLSSDARITGLTPGTATLRATSAGVTQSAPVEVFPAFTVISLSDFTGCAQTATRTLYCWGLDGGALGVISSTDTCPLHGGNAGCSMTPRKNGTTMSFAQVSGSCGLSDAGEVYCWGGNGAGQLGPTTERCDGTPCARTPKRIPGSVALVKIWAGGAQTCGLDATGKAYCWGLNLFGNLGGPAPDRCGPEALPCSLGLTPVSGGLSFQSLAVGQLHVCGIALSGAAYCWGTNATGQLGNGAGGGSLFEPAPVLVGGGLQFVSIAAGDGQTCGLVAGGQAYCWGNNDDGQLGTGLSTPSFAPAPVAGGITFGSLALGDRHSCGLTPAGRAYCWGHNGNPPSGFVRGKLGDGTDVVSRSVPTPVARDFVFVQLASHRNSTCGRVAGGNTYCWGSNLYGQLGVGDERPNSLSPIGVGGVP